MKRVLPFLAIIAAVVLFFILNRDGVESLTPDEPAAVEEPAPEVVARPDEAAASKPSVPHNHAAPEREALPVVRHPKPGPEPAVFRGRCVDPSGQPLAGVEAKVHAWGANSQRMDTYLSAETG